MVGEWRANSGGKHIGQSRALGKGQLLLVKGHKANNTGVGKTELRKTLDSCLVLKQLLYIIN